MDDTFVRFLEHTDVLPKNRRTHINVDGSNGYHWDGELQKLRAVMLASTFELPTLRKALDEALKEIESLKQQIVGETLSFETPKWEYRWGHIDFDDPDEMGADGWEATLVYGDSILYKRPK